MASAVQKTKKQDEDEFEPDPANDTAERSTENTQPGAEIKFLLPERVLTDERFNVRPWTSQQETEDQQIDDLARSIESLGQLDAALVIPWPGTGNGTGNGEQYMLISGHRRRRALSLINSKRSSSHTPLLKLRCTVDRSGGDPFAKAFAANKERKNLSAMDTALIIQGLRIKHGSHGKGTGEIARYLTLSKSEISKHEKLLLPEFSGELREKLHAGVISLDAALEIVREVPDGGESGENHKQVLDRAAEIQVNDAVEKISEEPGAIEQKQAKLDKATASAAQRLEAPSVRKAIKEVAPQATIKPTLKEVRELFESLCGSPLYGAEDGAVNQFLLYLVEQYLPGKGTERTLLSKFDRMVQNADKGTLESTEPKNKADAKAVVSKKPAAKKPATATSKAKKKS